MSLTLLNESIVPEPQAAPLPPAPASPLMDAHELRALLTVSTATFSRMKIANLLPRHLVLGLGHTHRWNRAEVMAWLQQGALPQKQWEALKASQARAAR